MPYPNLAKSLLALAIASSSLQAHAVIYDVSNGPIEFEGKTFTESLTITGNLTTEEDAVELADGTDLHGDLILDAQITVTGPQAEVGNYASAVDISGDGWGEAVQIDGQIINKGSLSASGLMAQGMTIEYADIEGGLVNDGSITITDGIDVNDAITEGNPSGIFVQNANIDGHVRNNGQIKVSGNDEADATGIQILDSDLAEADIINGATGSIEVSGEEARGFDISQVKIQSLLNAGSIKVNALNEALGIWLENVTGGAVSNSGDITATTQAGSDATGIKIDDSKLSSLSNTGSINVSAPAGEAVGIQIDDSDIEGSLANRGNIDVQSGDEAIGIELFNSNVDGLTNEGSVTVTNTSNTAVTASSEADTRGILLFGSDADGEVRNDGSIKVSGNKVAGIQILNSDLAKANIVNTGEIEADGKIAFGLDLSGVKPATVQSITNSGSIAVSASERSHGLYLDRVEASGSLNNSGSIIAIGNDSRAIRLEQASIAGGIHNSGTIKGDDFGIWIGDNTVALVHVTQSAGLLQGGQYAVQGGSGNQVSVELAGGTISGNLAGIFKLDVTGKGIFDGDSISTVAPSTGEAGKGWVDLYKSSDSPNGTAGHLVLLRPHTTLNGELEVNTGATVELGLSQATNDNQAILDVKGDAYFANGSRLLLTPAGSDFSADGKQYLLLAAEAIDNQGLQVSSSSALLNIDQFNVGDNQIVATVSGKATSEADDILVGASASGNAQAAFTPFYSGVLSKMDSNDAVFQAFANAGVAELAKLAEQLTPQVDGAASQAATGAQGLTSSAVGSRTSSLRGGSSGSSFSRTGVWVQGLSSSADQGRRDGIAGYDANSKGISIGIDGKLSDNLTLGLTYSNLHTNVKSDTGNKTDVDSQLLTLYSGFEQGNLFVDASLSYGINDNSSKRYIAGTQAKGNYDSSLLGLNVIAGYGLHAGDITLEPRVAGRYSRVDIDGYREKGSSAALRTEDQRYEVIELGAGARLASQIRVGQGYLEPELRLMAYHDFAADQARSASSYVLGGTPFVTSGAKPSRDSYEAGIALNYRIGAFTLGGSYDRIGKSDFDADVFQAKVRYDF